MVLYIKKKNVCTALNLRSDRMDSNHQTPTPKADALPIVLLSVLLLCNRNRVGSLLMVFKSKAKRKAALCSDKRYNYSCLITCAGT